MKRPKPAQASIDFTSAEMAAKKGESKDGQTAAALQQYEALDGELWRVNRFDLLVADIDERMRVIDLPKFQMAISLSMRSWSIVRKLYGIYPMIPRRDERAEDYRTFERRELCEAMGITSSNLSEELEKVRGIWMAAVASPNLKVEQESTSKSHIANNKTELQFSDDELLEKYGMQGMVTTEETGWMAEKVRQKKQMLDNPMAGELARSSVLNELELRRIENRRMRTSKQLEEADRPREGSAQSDEELSRVLMNKAALQKEYERLDKRQTELMDTYLGQLKELDKIFPWMAKAKGGADMKGVFSDLIAAHRDWYNKKDNQLADGIYTATEIEVLIRASQQAPEPQYRAGQVMYLNAARAHLFDGGWRNQFALLTLKKMDAGWRAAAIEAGQLSGEQLTDLLSDDPVKGEYPALHRAPEVEGRGTRVEGQT